MSKLLMTEITWSDIIRTIAVGSGHNCKRKGMWIYEKIEE